MSQTLSDSYQYKEFLGDKANLSSRNRNEMCELAYSFRFQWSILGIDFVNSILSALTLIVLWWIWKCVYLRKVYSIVDMNLKIIFLMCFFCYSIAMANNFLTFSYKFIILIFNFSPCFYIWSGASCYFSQFYYGAICTLIFPLLHFVLFLERSIVSFVSKSWCKNGVFGFMLCLGIVIISMFPQYYILQNPFLYTNDRVYCGSMLTKLDTNVNLGSFYVCIFELVISVLDFLLYLYNKKQVKEYKERLHCFNLEQSFNLKAIQISMEIIFLFSMFHAITFCIPPLFYFLYWSKMDTASLVQENLLFELGHFTRICSYLIVVSFLWIHAQLRKRRNSRAKVRSSATEMDLYFEQFERIIS